MNKRMTEDQAKKTYERALKMEQEFGEYFTGESTFNNIHISIFYLQNIVAPIFHLEIETTILHSKQRDVIR